MRNRNINCLNTWPVRAVSANQCLARTHDIEKEKNKSGKAGEGKSVILEKRNRLRIFIFFFNSSTYYNFLVRQLLPL